MNASKNRKPAVGRAAALAAGGFCQKLRLTEDREFLIRLARHGAGRLVADLLWQKFWIDGSLSNDWAAAGRGLVAYVAQRPEYRARYRKLGSYLATKVLVGHLRNRAPLAFARDLKRLSAAVPSLIGVVIVTFLLTRALPGDPAAYFAGPAATPEAIEQVRTNLGLDKPLYLQFVRELDEARSVRA